jgi:hypothetical protein
MRALGLERLTKGKPPMSNMSDCDAVLAAIWADEGPGADGGYHCSNATILDATGLDGERVQEILRQLWRDGAIEGILVLGGRPYLQGIRRVLPGRPRVWKDDGFFTDQP